MQPAGNGQSRLRIRRKEKKKGWGGVLTGLGGDGGAGDEGDADK